jgi:ubiquinone/menaquinone biosynthesis C-methylase UbiE
MCILDLDNLVCDWNPMFDELVAKPLDADRGQPAERFGIEVPSLKSASGEVIGSRETPQIVYKTIDLRVPFPELASCDAILTQLLASNGEVIGWTVQLLMHDQSGRLFLPPSAISRIDNEITWSKYSAVYDQLLLHFPDYRDLLRKVSAEVGDARLCADLGAGTGNSTIQLLDDESDRRVWAVDSNSFMIQRLASKVGQKYHDRLTVLQRDIESMPYFRDGFFDAVTMVNTLYALENPQQCLKEAHRILNDSGVLVLTAPHSGTDVDRLLARLRQALEQQGIFDSSRDAFNNACQRHHDLSKQIHRMSVEHMDQLISDCGFQIRSCVATYVDAVMLIVASKR